MVPPVGMTDIFPAFSIGGVALLKLMDRIEPPVPVRWSVVGALALLLALYLGGWLHPWLPEQVGLPLYVGLLFLSLAIMVWNWRSKRAARRE